MKKEKVGTLHIMQGLPGSGKSTITNRLLHGKPLKVIRLNRDCLRRMLFPNFSWSEALESHIRLFELESAKTFINLGYDVVIDDTNLGEISQSQYKNFIKIKVYDLRYVDIDTCLIRNEQRRKEDGNFCSPEIIIKLVRKNGLLK